jgi:alpha-galactosidase
VRFEMLFHFGAFITESSGHLSEYVPYFRTRPDLIKKYCRKGYGGESRFYATCWPKWRRKSDRTRNELARNIMKMDMKRGLEYASEIIEAHLFNRRKEIYGSVLNNGLISNLPGDGVVEVATLVTSTGFNPCRFGALPPQMAALCDSNMRVFDCAVRGIMHNDRDAVYHAMMLDPLSGAACSPAEICAMTDELAAAEKAYIPRFMTKGLNGKRTRLARKKTVRIRARSTHARALSGPFQV